MVSNGKEYYEVQGFPIYANHSYFDPRRNGYTLFAGTLDSSNASPKDAAKSRRGAKKKGGRGGAGKEMWRLNIPITGKAMAMAGDVLFVAGEPMKFDDPSLQELRCRLQRPTGRPAVGRVRNRRHNSWRSTN